ncbi:MAG: hypothetical protein R3B47_11665 [Bacteroidia bacterium]
MHDFCLQRNLKQHWPRWLNIAAGYGAEGLMGRYGDGSRVIRHGNTGNSIWDWMLIWNGR